MPYILTNLKRKLFVASFFMLITAVNALAGPIFNRGDDTAEYLDNFAAAYGIDVESPWPNSLFSRKSKAPIEPYEISEIKKLGKIIITNMEFSNPLLGDIFKNFTVPSKQRASIDPLLDQAPYINNPTLQAIKNILGTPQSRDDCKNGECLSKDLLMQAVIGEFPAELADINPNVLAQLNAETLIAPLQYNTDVSTPTYGSPAKKNDVSKGMQADTQEVQAFNFIRYATGQVNPMGLISSQDYRNMLFEIEQGGLDQEERNVYRRQLANYLLELRTHAAQSSVAINNLYYIFGKRVSNPENNTSEAQADYDMATQFLNDDKWYDYIKTASPRALQQEMLIQLARLNYQMYKNQQLQEHLLLSVSMLQLQQLKQYETAIELNKN